MLKLIFGFLGLLVALAIAASLARSQLGWTLPFGPQTDKAAPGPQHTAVGARAAADQAPVPRRDGAATTARARPPQPPQPAPDAAKEKSVFSRQDEALQKSVDRYRRADP